MDFNLNAVNNLSNERIEAIKKIYNFIVEEQKKEDPNYQIISAHMREIKKLANINLLEFTTDNFIF